MDARARDSRRRGDVRRRVGARSTSAGEGGAGGIEAFEESRARATARALESDGARPTGSHAEVAAFAYLENAVESVRASVEGAEGVVVERTRGSTSGTTRGTWKTAYANATYVGVRVRDARARAEGWEEVALVVSAHVDTVHASVGGSDNGANCASALEATRAAARRIASDARTRGSRAMCDVEAKRCAVLVLMYSTAEEEGLVGAHGLMNNRDWFGDGDAAPRLGVVLNLESMGAGGPHRLFQARTDTRAGVEALRAWARVVPRASGNVFAEDIFNSGLINSGTDYAIFREFGDRETALFDFAYVERTSVYHTPRDRVKYVRPGSMRQSGENLLEFMSHYVRTGGFALNADATDAPPAPVSWYTVPGYGMVVHHAPRPERHATFFALPLVLLALFLRKAYLGDAIFASASASRTQAVTRARMEDTFRLMVAIPTVIIGCACGWIAAITGAAIAPAMVARAFGEPNVFVARPVGLVALSGAVAFGCFVAVQTVVHSLSFALLPLSVKMRSTDDAERVAQWSSLCGNVVVWGALTSRAVRAGIGSSYIAILWLFVPTVTMIAPTLLPWTFARTNDAVPAPPSADAMAFAVAAPLWITFPNAVVLLRVLQGVGSRSVVGDGLIYLYDAIGGAVIGVLVAATCASLAPSAAARAAAASCRAARVYHRRVRVRVRRVVHDVHRWSTMDVDVAATARAVARRVVERGARRARARRRLSNARRRARARSNAEFQRAFTLECSANSTFDFVNAVTRGACVIESKTSATALMNEARATGVTPPSFGAPTRDRDGVLVRLSVGESLRWVLAVDVRCVSRLSVSPSFDANGDLTDANETWIDVGEYVRGAGGTRFVVNGVGGASAPMEYEIRYIVRDAETRATYFAGNATAESEACANGRARARRLRVAHAVGDENRPRASTVGGAVWQAQESAMVGVRGIARRVTSVGASLLIHVQYKYKSTRTVSARRRRNPSPATTRIINLHPSRTRVSRRRNTTTSRFCAPSFERRPRDR